MGPINEDSIYLKVTGAELDTALKKEGLALKAVSTESISKQQTAYVQVIFSDNTERYYSTADVKTICDRYVNTHAAVAGTPLKVSEFFKRIIQEPNKKDGQQSREKTAADDFSDTNQQHEEDSNEWQEPPTRSRYRNNEEDEEKFWEALPSRGRSERVLHGGVDPSDAVSKLENDQKSRFDPFLNTGSVPVTLGSVVVTVPFRKNVTSHYTYTDNSFDDLLKRVAHIHGDLFLQATGLEGNTPLKMMTYMKHMVTKKLALLTAGKPGKPGAYEEFSAFLKKIDVAIEIENKKGSSDTYIAHIQKLLSDLPAGQSVMIAGGWTDVGGGHTIYLDIKKNSDSTFSVKIYNTGAGINFHASISVFNAHPGVDERPFSDKSQSYLEVETIPAKNMQNAIFWKLFHELNNVSIYSIDGRNSATSYSSKNIYQGLVPLLEGRQKPASSNIDHFITPQRSGVCSWSGLVAATAGDISKKYLEYFLFEIKMSSLNDLYTADPNRFTEQPANLMLKSTALVVSEAAKLHRANVIGLKEFEITNELARAFRGRAELVHMGTQQALATSAPTFNLHRHPFEVNTATLPQIAKSSTTDTEKAIPLVPILKQQFTWQAATLTQQLQGLLKYLSENNGYPIQTHLCFNHIISSLPIPTLDKDDFWLTIPENDRVECMKTLTQLSSLVVSLNPGNLLGQATLRTELLMNLYKLQAALYQLASTSKELQTHGFKDWDKQGLGLQRLANSKPQSSKTSVKSKRSLDDDMADSQNYDSSTYNQLKQLEVFFEDKIDFFINVPSYMAKCAIVAKNAGAAKEGHFIYRYYNANQTQINKLLTYAGLSVRDEIPLDLLKDVEGRFLPAEFCLLKQQILLIDFFSKNAVLPVGNKGIRWYELFRTYGNKVGIDIRYHDEKTKIFPYYNEAYWLHNNEYSKYCQWKATAEFNLTPAIVKNVPETDINALWITPLEEGSHFAHELQIFKILSHYKKNLFDLSKPDHQRVFRRLLFDLDCLATLLKKNPEVRVHLAAFIAQGLAYFKFHDNLSGQLFMIYMQQMLAERNVNKKEADVKAETAVEVTSKEHASIEALLQSMLKKAKTHEDKGLIIRQLLFQYFQDSPSWNDKQWNDKITDVIIAKSLNELLPIGEQYRNGHIELCNMKLFRLQAFPQMQRIFATQQLDEKESAANLKTSIPVKNESLTLVIKELTSRTDLLTDADPKINWDKVTWSGKFPSFKGFLDGKALCTFNATTLKFTVFNRSPGFIPNAILQDPLYQSLFGKYVPLHAGLQGQEYTFKDADGLAVKIFEGSPIIIQRQLTKEGPHYQYIERFSKKLNANFNKCNFWLSCDESKPYILITNKQSLEVLYVVNITAENDDKHYVVRKKNQPDLTLVETHYLPLSNFENLIYINLWGIESRANDKPMMQPAVLELPRIGLTFKIENQRAFSDQITGFYIAQKQHVPYLRTFKEFLLLENPAGKQKVLIRRAEFSDKDRGGLTSDLTQTELEENTKLASAFPIYYEYTIDSNGRLDAMNEGANIYLGYLLAGQGRYKEAQAILQERAHKLKRYSKREVEIFEWFFKLTKLSDNDPRFLTVVLTAMHLLLKNQRIYGTLHKVKLEFISLQYKAYLQTLNLSRGVVLNLTEELGLSDLPNSSTLTQRKLMLQKANQEPIRVSYTSEPVLYTPRKYLDTYEISKLIEKLDIRSVSRTPNYRSTFYNLDYLTKLTLNKDFHTLYHYAYTLTEDDKKEFIKFLTYCQLFHDNKSDSYNLLAIAIGIAVKPDKFFPLEQFMENLRENYEYTNLDEAVYAYNNHFGIRYHTRDETHAKDINDKNAKEYADGIIAREIKGKLLAHVVPEEPKASVPIPELTTFVLPAISRVREQTRTLFKKQAAGTNPNYTAGVALQKQLSSKEFAPLPYRGDDHLKLEANEKDQKAAAALAYTPSKLAERNRSQLMQSLDDYIKQEAAVQLMQFNELSLDKLNGNLTQLKTSLGNDDHKLNTDIQTLSNNILNLANKISLAFTQNRLAAHQQADLLDGTKDAFTITSLSLLFLGSPTLKNFQEINPFLTMEDVVLLRQQIISYHYLVTEQQAVKRQIKDIEAVASYLKDNPKLASYSDELEKDSLFLELVQKLYSNMTAVRSYDPVGNFPLLLFESIADIALRKDQVDDIQKLQKVPYIVLQKIMGSGKSKVLLPILALTLANGKQLPIIVVPEALFNLTSQDLKNSLGKIYNRFIHALQFERNTEFTVEKLTDLLGYLKNIQQNRECVIMTSKSLASLNNKYKEAVLLLAKQPSAELKQKVNILGDILTLLKKDGKAIIDEVDVVLNIRSEVCFTTGETVGIGQVRTGMLHDIYLCLRDPELHKLFGGDPLVECTMSSEEYHAKIKPAILESYLKHLVKDDSGSVYGFLFQDPKVPLNTIKNFLLNQSTEAEDLQISKLDNDFRTYLGLFKDQLNSVLPLSLTNIYCLHYGPAQDPRTRDPQLAKPYSGNNVIVKNAEFRSPDLLMNYTMQMWWKQGITPEEIEHYIGTLRKELETTGTNVNFENSRVYREFKKLCGKALAHINFFKITTKDYADIANQLNGYRTTDPEAFIEYVAFNIVDKIKLYKEQITCNAIDLAKMFGSVIGFTGTPMNSDSYAAELMTVVEHTPATDGKSLALLQRHTSKPGGIHPLTQTPYPECLKELIKPNDHSFIDVSSVFNGYENERVARDMLNLLRTRNPQIKGVLFFKDNKPVVLELLPESNIKEKPGESYRVQSYAKSTLKPEERFTYYDQAHSTGTDIVQSRTATATTTVGKMVSLRDVSQGIWRLRGLDQQQSISLDLTHELTEIICKRFNIKPHEITFAHIFHHIESVQQDQQIAFVIDSLKQKIESIVKGVVEEYLRDVVPKETVENSSYFVDKIQSILAVPIAYDPIITREKLIPTKEMVERLWNGVHSKLTQIRSGLFKQETFKLLESKINAGIERELNQILPLLPSHISSNLFNKTSEGNVERELETEKQSQQELEIQNAVKVYHPDLSRTKYHWWANKNNPAPAIFNAGFYESPKYFDSRYMGFVNMGEGQIYGLGFKTKNLFSGILISKNRASIKDDLPIRISDFYEGRQEPAQYVLYMWDPVSGDLKVALLDGTSDLAFYWEALSLDRAGQYRVEKPQARVKLCIAELSDSMGERLLQHDKTIDPTNNNDSFLKVYRSPDAVMLRLRMRIALGEIDFKPGEIARLSLLAKDIGENENKGTYYAVSNEKIQDDGRRLIKQFYVHYIFTHDPEKGRRYRNSTLAKFLEYHG